MALHVKEWTRDHFISNKSDCNLLLENVDVRKEIPCLNTTSLDYFKDGQLVRFRGMIQDMFNPEYYCEKYEVIDTNTGVSQVRCGTYTDSVQCLPHENIKNESQHLERQSYFIISIPGLNDWAKEKVPIVEINNAEKNISKRPFDTADEEAMDCTEPVQKKERTAESPVCTSENSKQSESTGRIVSKEHILNFPVPNEHGKACIVKIYEDGDSYKLNDVLDVIGFLSLNPLLSVFHDSEEFMDDVEAQTHNPPASMVPRLHAVKIIPLKKSIINNDPDIICKAELIRSDLQMVISQLLFGDLLAADYLICHLISSIYLRKDPLCLGTFPLNITKFPLEKYKSFPKELYSMLSHLVPKSHYVELTLECLNDQNFIPKKDYQCNRLTSGILQLSNNTHLIIDETSLSSGQVTSCGRKNYDAINNLVLFQKVAYDFQWYQLDYETDIPVLILSEVKSFIPCIVQVPLAVDPESENLYPQVLEAAKQYLKNENRLNNIRQYLNTLRHGVFELNNEISEVIQEDFVKMRQANKFFTGEELHTLIVFARLMALSYGNNTLTTDMWKKTYELETERIGRLPKRNDQ